MSRIKEFDGLRGIAAMTIVLYHVTNDGFPWGWAAVDLFFVLSGYLITSIVLKHGQSRTFLTSFYARRGLRIWPIYYLLIAYLVISQGHAPRSLPYYLTYTQEIPRYWGGSMEEWKPISHTWTLALEEQFYLVWPLLLLVIGRRFTAPIALAVTAMSIGFRLSGMHWWLLLARCDGFALGGFLAALMNDENPDRKRVRVSWSAAIAAIVALGLLVHLGMRGAITVDQKELEEKAVATAFASYAIIAYASLYAGHWILAPLRTRVLTYLGTISYGIYLYHYFIYQDRYVIKGIFNLREGVVIWSIEVAQTLIVASLSWYLVEKRLLRLKDRVPYEARKVEA